MGNISDHLPKQSKTVKAIYDYHKTEGDKGHMNRTLAISLLGRPCERFLWYSFRQCCKPNFDGRMYRLFERGNLEEARLTADLRAIGCEVHVIDESTEKQFKVKAFGGHLKGYMDGCALVIPEAPKTWHVLEFKTHNAKSYRELCKKGLKESKFEHYAQVMIYMHLTGMKRALYLAVNKDTEDIYAERIRYDKKEAEALMEKAHRIISAPAPPARIAGRSDDYRCEWCDAQQICWGGGNNDVALPIPALSCRQCCHATPITREPLSDQPWWHCEKQEAPISCDKICNNHLVLPSLIPFAEANNYGKDENDNEWIEFRNQDGPTWRHGNAPGCIASKALMSMSISSLTNGMVQTACELFKAKATDCSQDILSRYPESDSRTIWMGPAHLLVEAWRKAYDEDLTKLRPVAHDVNPDSHVIELSGGRVAILWNQVNPVFAEIREGVE